MVITRKTKWKYPPKLCLYGEPIPYKRTAIYLGVNLAERLNWKPHVLEHKIPACKKRLMQIVSCSGKNSIKWGLSPLAMQYAWKGITRPILLYGDLVWGQVARFVDVQKKLYSLHEKI